MGHSLRQYCRTQYGTVQYAVQYGMWYCTVHAAARTGYEIWRSSIMMMGCNHSIKCLLQQQDADPTHRTNETTNERMKERASERTNERRNEPSERTNERVNEWTNWTIVVFSRASKQKNECITCVCYECKESWIGKCCVMVEDSERQGWNVKNDRRNGVSSETCMRTNPKFLYASTVDHTSYTRTVLHHLYLLYYCTYTAV